LLTRVSLPKSAGVLALCACLIAAPLPPLTADMDATPTAVDMRANPMLELSRDAESQVTSQPVVWLENYGAAFHESRRTGKPLLIRIGSVWCGACRQMKQTSLADHRVQQLIAEHFVPLDLDADRNPDLVQAFAVNMYPTTFVVAPDRTILQRMVGYQSTNAITAALEKSRADVLLATSDSSSDAPVSAVQPENGSTAYSAMWIATTIREVSPRLIAFLGGQPLAE
jgi:thiol:disulfide interchange protein